MLNIFILNVNNKKFIDENLLFLIKPKGERKNKQLTLGSGRATFFVDPERLFVDVSPERSWRHSGQFYLFIVNNKNVFFNMFFFYLAVALFPFIHKGRLNVVVSKFRCYNQSRAWEELHLIKELKFSADVCWQTSHKPISIRRAYKLLFNAQ